VTEPAVVVEDVSKRFKLYNEKPSYLKERITGGTKARYDMFWALKNVSLEVPKGTMYGLIGHNGSGKSTLLRMMANIHRPTSGRVVTHGRISALLELGAGFHPQLSGRENIYLNASILGLGRKEIAGKIDEIVDFAGIGQFIDTPVKVYSSGMYVRLGFSVAVHVNPEILLIDEVIAVGDEEFQRRCFDHLFSLRQQGVTIVMVTHSMGLVQTMCDHAAWLDRGEVQLEDDAVKVVREYLKKVNAAEGERLGEAGGEIVGAMGRRAGTGEIVIEGVDYVNTRRTVTPVGSTGDPLVVRIRYNAREPVEDPVFTLGFHHDGGTLVGQPNTRLAQFKTGTLHGEGYLFYKFDRLPLTPGTYHLSATVTDSHSLHRYDVHEREFELHVQPGASSQAGGYVDLQGEWSFPKNKSESAGEGSPAA
jgi:ABC-2 type transport system ATP-binding protein/lipopolysaccharide transport system ATP-binding protein